MKCLKKFYLYDSFQPAIPRALSYTTSAWPSFILSATVLFVPICLFWIWLLCHFRPLCLFCLLFFCFWGGHAVFCFCYLSFSLSLSLSLSLVDNGTIWSGWLCLSDRDVLLSVRSIIWCSCLLVICAWLWMRLALVRTTRDTLRCFFPTVTTGR